MRRDELIVKMAKQVNKVVKYYVEDFYRYDLNDIFKYHDEQKPVELLWVIRESGTHFFDSAKEEYLQAIDENWAFTKQFLITFDGSFNWNMKLLKSTL